MKVLHLLTIGILLVLQDYTQPDPLLQGEIWNWGWFLYFLQVHMHTLGNFS